MVPKHTAQCNYITEIRQALYQNLLYMTVSITFFLAKLYFNYNPVPQAVLSPHNFSSQSFDYANR